MGWIPSTCLSSTTFKPPRELKVEVLDGLKRRSHEGTRRQKGEPVYGSICQTSSFIHSSLVVGAGQQNHFQILAQGKLRIERFGGFSDSGKKHKVFSEVPSSTGTKYLHVNHPPHWLRWHGMTGPASSLNRGAGQAVTLYDVWMVDPEYVRH